MKLILVRHGIAEDKFEHLKKSIDDSTRPLTAKGKKRIESLTEILVTSVDDLALIATSPYARAHQTAEIISKKFPKVPLRDIPELTPQIHPSAVLKWLRMNGPAKGSVLLVGHEPHLGLLSSYLLVESLNPFIEIKKGGLVAFEISSWKELEPKAAYLTWVLPPKL